MSLSQADASGVPAQPAKADRPDPAMVAWWRRSVSTPQDEDDAAGSGRTRRTKRGETE